MARRRLPDRSYFDDEAAGATCFPPKRTGAPERLWNTSAGSWVMQRESAEPPYVKITSAEAAAWLQAHAFDIPPELEDLIAEARTPASRPPSADDGKAREVVPIRLSPAEKQRAQEEGTAQGRNLSEHVRHQLFEVVDVVAPLRRRLLDAQNIHAVLAVAKDAVTIRKLLEIPGQPIVPPEDMLEALARWAYQARGVADSIAEAFGFDLKRKLRARLGTDYGLQPASPTGGSR
jgi:hypothetical protein